MAEGLAFRAVGIAEEAIKRITKIYAVEKEARGQPPDARGRLRQEHAKPVLDDLEPWLQVQLQRISGKSELAKAIRYALGRMKKLRPYLDHGFLEAWAAPRFDRTAGIAMEAWAQAWAYAYVGRFSAR
jgi:hypothetical protein